MSNLYIIIVNYKYSDFTNAVMKVSSLMSMLSLAQVAVVHNYDST